ncbi:hypothetical protein J6590_015715 [Homalodisca vitripennis]|nr:hypothetical protein J6590_015715 [Homalodisca vitripennis]
MCKIMRAWWWFLLTAQLVRGDPESFHDFTESDVNQETTEERGTEKESPIQDPGLIFTRRKRSSEDEEREKRQPKFHSWGGKRYGDEEEDNEDSFEFTSLNKQDLNNENSFEYVPLYVPFNLTSLKTNFKHNNLDGQYIKRSFAFTSWGGKRDPEVVNELEKRPEFSVLKQSSFGPSTSELNAKRYPAFNSWAGKRAAAFNSWGGKRAAAFNSWGGKRAAAFNSWGGKRAAAFNSWGGKRDAAFNSWGGKRMPAFNSWGGKRAAAFNSWGGKRIPAFNSWGGKRAAAFNSWGGKRAAAFNSWGGKRAQDLETWQRENQDHISNFDNSAKNNQFYDLVSSNHVRNYDTESDINDLLSHADVEGNKQTKQLSNEQSNGTEETELNIKNVDEKRTAPLNSWASNRDATFNSWGGKRGAAFNSWGGKRTAAFNSWGGKRAAAFNSWGGKRAAAFNSWGGKRKAAFNSWGGKRAAAAFNSWGGKRAAAFNSWGGKRAAPFNSWGGKRAVSFNSWGGKRDESMNPPGENPMFLGLEMENNGSDINNELDKNVYGNPQFQTPFLDQTSTLKQILDGVVKQGEESFKIKENDEQNINTAEGGSDNHDYDLDSTVKYDNTFSDNGYSDGNDDSESVPNKRGENDLFKIQQRYPGFSSWAGKRDLQKEIKEKRASPAFSSWAGKRSPLFSAWYGSKIPIVQVSNGKRRPAFSSWGGKRSENYQMNEKDTSDCSLSDINEGKICPGVTEADLESLGENHVQSSEGKNFKRKKREVDCSTESSTIYSASSCRDKRSNGNVKKNKVISRMLLQGGLTWPLMMKTFPRSVDFYAWGGKRSL